MLNGSSYNLFWRKKILKKNGEDGLTNAYHRSPSRYLLMEDHGKNSKDQED